MLWLRNPSIFVCPSKEAPYIDALPLSSKHETNDEEEEEEEEREGERGRGRGRGASQYWFFYREELTSTNHTDTKI